MGIVFKINRYNVDHSIGLKYAFIKTWPSEQNWLIYECMILWSFFLYMCSSFIFLFNYMFQVTEYTVKLSHLTTAIVSSFFRRFQITLSSYLFFGQRHRSICHQRIQIKYFTCLSDLHISDNNFSFSLLIKKLSLYFILKHVLFIITLSQKKPDLNLEFKYDNWAFTRPINFFLKDTNCTMIPLLESDT